MQKENFKIFLKIVLVLTFVYLFLVSIGLMGAAFKGFGKAFAENLIRSTSNPFIGLFIGILATSIVQSSSTTTSIVVGMSASGVITLNNAIPIIMGANIGTTVTAVLVSLGHINRRDEFKRAITGATVHDFFNMICVIILFPLELTTGFLHKAALWMSEIFADVGGIKFTSPVKLATEPTVNLIKHALLDGLNMPSKAGYIAMLIISIVILFLSLYFIVKVMKTLVVKRAEIVLNNVIGRSGALAILAGILFTAFVQSSSITTSLMVPLVAAGVLTVESVFPIVMGANIGTTVTAILASFATGNVTATAIAFSHLLFNVIGVFLIYPIKIFRAVPIRLAKGLGNLAFKKRRYAVMYVLTVFFIIPFIFIMISEILNK
ncbi:MAG: Na/Pi symporter [Candidatus Omnitrophica bacterium]|nr:Na/Pi symporter [Candidatus Omnitrophota bacterium]MBU4458091.1 Na/Pi symporter [Candidatus Omnitrophota bacterium]